MNTLHAGCGCLMLIMGVGAQAQELPAPYRIDGAVSHAERRTAQDSAANLITDQLTVVETDAVFYVGIQSNTRTIANVYAMGADVIKIMHASAALGEYNYLRQDGQWHPDREQWQWRYRDLTIWDELHAQPLQDMASFYAEFGWFANTISQGSYREWEFVISKKIVKDIRDLGVTFTYQGEVTHLVNQPTWFNGVTDDKQINQGLHNGDMPASIVPNQ
ncbi:hypothetical protein [Marinicella meishanensis]|uniref:hypothetical protein n=1 Tax=Marinicella meishanensis TaxID=2873263 RepID=UPI001CC17ACB|nr:hypothetical protein [Marinicella sp. NBU2979]